MLVIERVIQKVFFFSISVLTLGLCFWKWLWKLWHVHSQYYQWCINIPSYILENSLGIVSVWKKVLWLHASENHLTRKWNGKHCLPCNLIMRFLVTFGSKIDLMLWLTLIKWGCLLDDCSKLAMEQPNSRWKRIFS